MTHMTEAYDWRGTLIGQDGEKIRKVEESPRSAAGRVPVLLPALRRGRRR